MRKVIAGAYICILISISLAIVRQSPYVYLLGCAITTFVCFGLDKFFAIKGMERLPERFLLFLSLIGGAIPACAAMVFFRHKIRKFPFWLFVCIMALAHLLAWLCLKR